MQLFLENGHLSNEGLQALLAGSLNELESLEAAEHLAFCEDCLASYTALLEEETLSAPEHSLYEPVMKRIRKRTVRLGFGKYATIAAAAVIAVALWAVATFALPYESTPQKTQQPDMPAQSEAAGQRPEGESLRTRIDKTLNQANTALGNFFNPYKAPDQTADTKEQENLQPQADSQPQQQTSQPPEDKNQKIREEREAALKKSKEQPKEEKDTSEPS